MLDGIRNKAQSFGVKLIFGIIIIVFVFWGVGNLGGVSSDSLAFVNGEKISVREFGKAWEQSARAERKANPQAFEHEEIAKQYKRMLLDELISVRLLQQEAERLGIAVTAHEIKSVVDTYTEFQTENGKFDPARYRQTVAALGLTPGEFEEDLRQQLIRTKLVRYLGMTAGLSEEEMKNLYTFRLEKRPVEYVLFAFDEYAAKVQPSEEEITARYEKDKELFRQPVRVSSEYLLLNPDSLASSYPAKDEEIESYYTNNKAQYHRPASFQTRHIFILAPSDGSGAPVADEAGAKAEEKLKFVLDGLKNGEDFADLAKKYSDDTSSADLGGMLGWLNAGETGSPELEELAFSLKPNEVGKPLYLEQGWHILKLVDKKEARELALAEVRDEIALTLGSQKAEADFTATQHAAEDGLNMGTPLVELAAKFNVSLHEATLVPQAELEKLLRVQSDSKQILNDAIASAATGTATTIPVPLNIEGGIAIVHLKDGRPSEVPPLAEIVESVRTLIKNEKGRELARSTAEEALPLFSGQDVPDNFRAKVQKSASPAVRVSPSLEPLGSAPGLIDDLFAAPAGKWLAYVHDTPSGIVIARAVSIEPVTDEEWRAYGPTFMNRYRRYWSGQSVQTFLQNLHKTAKIEVSLELLDRLNTR